MASIPHFDVHTHLKGFQLTLLANGLDNMLYLSHEACMALVQDNYIAS